MFYCVGARRLMNAVPSGAYMAVNQVKLLELNADIASWVKWVTSGSRVRLPAGSLPGSIGQLSLLSLPVK